MRTAATCTGHGNGHAFKFLRPREREGVVVYGRRSVLKSSIAGIGGLCLPALLGARARGETAPGRDGRAVILLWMTGGPSQIDTWDPKPDMPAVNRGPFRPIATKLPGVQICEYLPKQAAMLDRFTLIRSMDAHGSSHEPNMVMQTANRQADGVNPRSHLYPAIGSIVAREHGGRCPEMPPYVVLNLKSRSHVAGGGALGKAFDPFDGRMASQVLGLSAGLSADRLADRRRLLADIDGMRAALDRSEALSAADRFTQQAFDIVLGGRAREAFEIDREPAAVRERYGKHEWARQALLARRLVEAGSSFVTIDLSNTPNSGSWDNHGDNHPPYGGIWNGLRPLLPVFDHVISTLVSDLEERGLLDRTLVVAMGEFGRTPRVGTQGSTDGRDHWVEVMSACLAGGGLRHGQVIGRSSRDGGEIAARPVMPADIAATIFHHMGIPNDVSYLDHQGRPTFVIEDGGQPLAELI